MNYNAIFNFNKEITSEFVVAGIKNIDYIKIFYNFLCSIGISIAIILMLIDIPYLNNSYSFEEKSILIITRLNEKDANDEINSIESYSNIILNLISSGLPEKIEEIKRGIEKKRKSITLIPPKKKKESIKNYKTNRKREHYYLSSLITRQRRSRKDSIILALITIVSVTSYFTAIFYFQSKIVNYLNINVSASSKISDLSNSFGYISTSEFILKTYQMEKFKKLSSDKQIFLKNFKNSFDILSNFFIDSVKTFFINDIIEDNIKNQLNLILNENMCNVIKNNVCNQNKIRSAFKFGILGFLSEKMKYLREVLPELEGNLIRKVLFSDQEKFEEEILKNYLMMIGIYKLEEIVKNANDEIIKKLFNQLLLLFLLGGGLCATILGFILLYQCVYIKNKMLASKRLLLLIPTFKYSENSILTLIKNLCQN